MKIAVYQTNPALLNVKANVKHIVQLLEDAKRQHADLAIFPELSLTGYCVDERFHDVALRVDSAEIDTLCKATKRTAAIIGFIEESPEMLYYNAAMVAVDGKMLFTYRKISLPNYGPFNEGIIFSSGECIRIFEVNGFRICPLICSDLWHPALPYLAILQRVDVLVAIVNSSEGAMGNKFSNIKSWNAINQFYPRIFGVYYVFVNRAGSEIFESRCINRQESWRRDPENSCENLFKFWGGSEIIDPFGQVIKKAVLYDIDTIFAEISKSRLRDKRLLLPFLKVDNPLIVHRELTRILFPRNSLRD